MDPMDYSDDDNVSYLENDGASSKPRIGKASSLTAVLPKKRNKQVEVSIRFLIILQSSICVYLRSKK